MPSKNFLMNKNSWKIPTESWVCSYFKNKQIHWCLNLNYVCDNSIRKYAEPSALNLDKHRCAAMRIRHKVNIHNSNIRLKRGNHFEAVEENICNEHLLYGPKKFAITINGFTGVSLGSALRFASQKKNFGCGYMTVKENSVAENEWKKSFANILHTIDACGFTEPDMIILIWNGKGETNNSWLSSTLLFTQQLFFFGAQYEFLTKNLHKYTENKIQPQLWLHTHTLFVNSLHFSLSVCVSIVAWLSEWSVFVTVLFLISSYHDSVENLKSLLVYIWGKWKRKQTEGDTFLI